MITFEGMIEGFDFMPHHMEASDVWSDRWTSNTGIIARNYMSAAVEKQSLVCLAADRPTIASLTHLVGEVGPYIAALKTHVDLIDDWNAEEWEEFCRLAKQHNLLIFEDRKFADIGKISQQQLAGLYDIRSWADLVTAHLISGPDIVDGLQNGWDDVGRQGGVLLLAQMSSRGNRLTPSYTAEVVAFGREHEGVFGFIGNGSNPTEVADLRKMVGQSKLIWTPGVNIATGDGAQGQRYGHPHDAVVAGSDCLIVGSGIHQADHPAEAAQQYAQHSWNGLVERSGRGD